MRAASRPHSQNSGDHLDLVLQNWKHRPALYTGYLLNKVIYTLSNYKRIFYQKGTSIISLGICFDF